MVYLTYASPVEEQQADTRIEATTQKIVVEQFCGELIKSEFCPLLIAPNRFI